MNKGGTDLCKVKSQDLIMNEGKKNLRQHPDFQLLLGTTPVHLPRFF